MPGKDPNPNPGTKVPEVRTTSHTCPFCGKVNTVTLDQSLGGYTCPGCGKNTKGIFDGAETVKMPKCPRCNSDSVQSSDGGKHFRCLKCKAEW